MPFLATCPFCPAKFQLSRKALGGSVRCPECGNYFTAVPPEEETPLVTAPSLRALAGKKRPTAPPAGEESSKGAGEDQGDVASISSSETGAGLEQTSPPVIRRADEVASPSLPPPAAGTPIPRWISVWGLAALALGVGGLFFAAVSPWILPLRYLAIPSAGLGLLVCLLGLLATMDDRKTKDVVWLFLGGVVSLGVLVVTIFWGHLLNMHWGADFAVPKAFPDEPMQVSIRNPKVGKAVTDAEWIDAGKAAYRQGDVYVKVMEVKIDQAPLEPPLKDNAAMRSLLISLKVANVGQLRTISYAGQGSGKHSASLKDSHGTTLAARHFPAESQLLGQTTQAVLRANKQVEDLLVFEIPAADVRHLDLELSAAAWGGTGTCKLRIPGRMIAVVNPRKEG
jgi:predicted Zn finger-like uncharacterized protein